MGNLVPHFSATPVTPSPTAWTPSAASQTPSPGAPSSERHPTSPPAAETPRRSGAPRGQTRRPARPVPWDPVSRPATAPSPASPRLKSPRPRRLFASTGSDQSEQSDLEVSPSCTVPWASPTGSDGMGSPPSPWTRSSCSSGTPSPIYSPSGYEGGPYGRNAYFACSPGPYESTPQR